MKLRWMLGLITILAIIGALAWGAVRLVRATSTSSSQELPTTKVKRGKVVLTVAARGELQGAVPALQQIQKHEAAHVAFLSANGASNTLNLNADSFDFTGNRGNQPAGPFARATTELPFLLAVAQGAEDTASFRFRGPAAVARCTPAQRPA